MVGDRTRNVGKQLGSFRTTRHFGIVVALCAMILLLAYVLLDFTGASYIGWWLLTSALVSAYVCGYAWKRLRTNHPSGGGNPFRDLGLANAVTLIRGVLIAMVAGFVCFRHPEGVVLWAPAILYTVAAAMDGLDGKIARATGRVSLLGVSMDMEFDSIGVLAASAVAVRYGRLPVWFLLVGLARYLFLVGTWALERAGRSPRPLPPSAIRRFMAGTMMAFLAVALYPVVPHRLLLAAGIAVFVPFMGGFVRDFLYVTGWPWKREEA